MKDKLLLGLEIKLCDRNRNFDEIVKSIYQVIKERDGVEGFKIITEKFASSENSKLRNNK